MFPVSFTDFRLTNFWGGWMDVLQNILLLTLVLILLTGMYIPGTRYNVPGMIPGTRYKVIR